jgi:hypothetical protein
LVATAIIVRTIVALSLGFLPFDDTFITFRYAANLAAGNGFVYNVSEHVLGTTSPLWALILAVARATGMDLALFSQLTALAADAATAILLIRLLGHLKLGRSVRFGAAVLFLSLFDYLSMARSGMETSLFVFLIVGTLATALDRPTTACILASLSILTRPEGLILIPILALTFGLRSSYKQALVGIALLAVSLGAWSAFASVYFGSPIPQPIHAKANQVIADPGLRGFSWMNLRLFLVKGQFGGGVFERTYLQMNFLLSGLAGLTAINLLRHARKGPGAWQTRPVLLLGFPAALVTAQAAGHALTWFPWYYGPVYPFLGALAAIGLDGLARMMPGRSQAWSRPWFFGLGLSVLVAGQCLAALFVKLPNHPDFVPRGYSMVAKKIPPAAPGSVAALEIGAVGWTVWPRPVIDLLGLVTPAAVGTPPLATIKEQRPEFLVFRTDDAARLLAEARRDSWFMATYLPKVSLRDPWRTRDFLVFQKRDPSQGSPHLNGS